MFFVFKQKTAYEMRISDWSSDVCSSDLRSICPRHQNHASGTTNTTPMRRPHRRWMYSHQKIVLNSSRLMPAFTCWYSGIWRYSAKSRSHSAWLSGGRAPLIGAHSMIESPDSVSRSAEHTSELQSLMRISYAVY